MAERMIDQGYYSLVRWLNDPKREEAKNLGVLLVDSEGRFGEMKSASVASISRKLAAAGIVDTFLGALEQRFEEDPRPTRDDIRQLHAQMGNSLQVTEPRPTAVIEGPERTIEILYQAYVAVAGGGPSGMPKGRLIGHLSRALERHGLQTHAHTYVGEFQFDLVASVQQKHGKPRRAAVEVLSFATRAREWTDTEHEVGHFLYGLQRTDIAGVAVVNPPNERSAETAWRTHERVTEWLSHESIPMLGTEVIKEPHKLLAALN